MIKVKALLQSVASKILHKKAKAKTKIQYAIANTKQLRAKHKTILRGIAFSILHNTAKAKTEVQEAVAKTIALRAKQTAFVEQIKVAIIKINTLGKDLQDNAGFSDSGFIKMQDYAQTDYFAEEYVLTTRDF